MKIYDYIVIGAGTTGNVLASRLSEDKDTEVLLLEAGKDYQDNMPEELLDPSVAVMQGHNWPFDANIHTNSAGSLSQEMKRAAGVLAVASSRMKMMKTSINSLVDGVNPISKFHYPMGKVVGGGSAVNGALAMVPSPLDFEQWVELGNTQWRWVDVAPYFDRLIKPKGGTPIINIETVQPSDFTSVQESFYKICKTMGYAEIDLASSEHCGVGGIPKNVVDGKRLSTDTAYLSSARGRKNFTLISECLVDKLIFEIDGRKAIAKGVEAYADNKGVQFYAENIVLCAGAINSPAILLRSGVGDSNALEKMKIPIALDLSGVGKNLVDHPSVSIWGTPKTGTSNIGEPLHQVLLRAASGELSSQQGDLQLFMLGGVPTRQFPPLYDIVGSEVAIALSVMLGKPFSTGEVCLKTRSPSAKPVINLNCLTEKADMVKMKEGVRLAWEIIQASPLASKIENLVMWNQSVISSDKNLENMINTVVRGSLHPVGTLRMGSATDSSAVTDQSGKLHGCDNVIVADASLMPTIPSTPTNLTCIAIGERIADGLMH